MNCACKRHDEPFAVQSHSPHVRGVSTGSTDFFQAQLRTCGKHRNAKTKPTDLRKSCIAASMHVGWQPLLPPQHASSHQTLLPHQPEVQVRSVPYWSPSTQHWIRTSFQKAWCTSLCTLPALVYVPCLDSV